MLGNGLGRGFTGHISSSFYIARQSILHPSINPNTFIGKSSIEWSVAPLPALERKDANIFCNVLASAEGASGFWVSRISQA